MVDQDKDFIVIWVPGTGGHEVHPDFEKAVENQLGDRAALYHIDYPAEWDLARSVEEGKRQLASMLEIMLEHKAEDQLIVVAGSSQGAWVLSEVLLENDHYYLNQIHKAVAFGHPGLSEYHDHEYEVGDTFWEIVDPKDAVHFSWHGKQRKVLEAFSRLVRGDVRGLPLLLRMVVKYPLRLPKLLMLVLYHGGYLPWGRSPHDYSRQMPLAVYWLTH